jgi:hypothetical protein
VAAAAPSLAHGAKKSKKPEPSTIGREVAVPRHLADGEEFSLPLRELLFHGRTLFTATWTDQEGGGRPLTKGNGAPLVDPSSPLVAPRNFNRVSAPDSNSCAGCHNAPYGIPGGGGDIVANAFVLGQRFDFATFDASDTMPTRGSMDESGKHATLQEIANSRNTPAMFGSGYIEMLARQMTLDLQALRDATPPGGATPLVTKGVDFGVLARGADGSWITDGVEGLPGGSVRSTGPASPPSLVIRPFSLSGGVVSLRQFTNNAFNHHHGIQSAERFGQGADPDGDGFGDEMTRADVTAATLYQAVLPVPGRVIPRDRAVERAVREGEHLFVEIGCADCHVPSLPLVQKGWIFAEPNPFNSSGNLLPGEAETLRVDLNRSDLPGPRLAPQRGVVHVPAFTDLKIHDVTSGPGDPNREPLNPGAAGSSAALFSGNSRFLTRKLWGTANDPPYFHHGRFTTMREATLAHAGEAETARAAFTALAAADQDAVIEFLKTLQVLPPGTRDLVVDERGNPRHWPSFPH